MRAHDQLTLLIRQCTRCALRRDPVDERRNGESTTPLLLPGSSKSKREVLWLYGSTAFRLRVEEALQVEGRGLFGLAEEDEDEKDALPAPLRKAFIASPASPAPPR